MESCLIQSPHELSGRNGEQIKTPVSHAQCHPIFSVPYSPVQTKHATAQLVPPCQCHATRVTRLWGIPRPTNLQVEGKGDDGVRTGQVPNLPHHRSRTSTRHFFSFFFLRKIDGTWGLIRSTLNGAICHCTRHLNDKMKSHSRRQDPAMIKYCTSLQWTAYGIQSKHSARSTEHGYVLVPGGFSVCVVSYTCSPCWLTMQPAMSAYCIHTGAPSQANHFREIIFVFRFRLL